jgi:hypothetical protein
MENRAMVSVIGRFSVVGSRFSIVFAPRQDVRPFAAKAIALGITTDRNQSQSQFQTDNRQWKTGQWCPSLIGSRLSVVGFALSLHPGRTQGRSQQRRSQPSITSPIGNKTKANVKPRTDNGKPGNGVRH